MSYYFLNFESGKEYQYDMTTFDDLARENAKGREEIEKIIKGK